MTTDDLTLYVGAFVDELVESGVVHAVISPGSRSTPLAMMMAEHPGIKVWMHVDERSAGFFALGLAKARQEPVVLLCTSGTAAANYLPAVVEAKLARVPLLVLTADRPHELRDVGAPQAIDQIKLFGSHVKWFTEMALPESSEAALRYVRTAAGRAAGAARTGPKGPVHLNFPFREPLLPRLDAPDLFQGGKRDRGAYVRLHTGRRNLDPVLLDSLAAELTAVQRGVIICGPQEDPRLAEAVVPLARALGFPILADPLSRLRYGSHDKELVLDGYDAFLRVPRVVEEMAPEAVVRFGAMPVSKALMLYLKDHSACRHIVVDADEGWREPTALASDMVYGDPAAFCEGILTRIGGGQARSSVWQQQWTRLNRITGEVLRSAAKREGALFEGRVFAELHDWLPEGVVLFAGNSMPIRDMDTFMTNREGALLPLANRGANGIDGVVSSAMGAAAAGNPVVLVIGDLSFFHDMNGLLAAKWYGLNITIVLVNNDGGGIFSFLPQAQEKTHFEQLFGTPIGLDYAQAVRMYGGIHQRVTEWNGFREAVLKGISGSGWTVVEVPTDREENVRMHREIWQEAAARVESALQEEWDTCD
ncbi:2-succinyl-5-enolpyruvyl-6-hydroxy-3-cyclohexene-1-carboxylate synthase [Marinithermofilum abyssi]|uniref:2-succinyl-5-enolpyruvyl-6-hydroxy-3-cyclohexene-1-carboxylate synthase n=1 Tax=Marinithermofilum abyssi TaxID=1571185 RepID=A0A8J2Y9L1_9BACL|nr:2-succinyl-5-enolpyruvyl-6-hydroxy-3-cyclohexene-1-carboxylic-acid synthase [Marinithermofilum abyssi]GGE25654.1 2-succinyl-5-enolpyruvyl-6-hydroxy-3-cyclohexene-1-carboxylate synthase [Marinithermofilum abyssi]